MNACEGGKGPPDPMLAKPGAICFWQPILSGLNLVVAAVLRDSLCVMSLLPCMADCCMLYTVCKAERLVLTIIKRKIIIIIMLLCRSGVVVECWTCDQKSWVRVSAGHYGVKTLGKFLTPMCLCHQGV